MVVCPSLSPFTMMKITTYGGRHLSHIQPFLSLSRVLFRARTFCFSTRYPYRTERPPAAQFQICRAEKLSPSGRLARKRRERSLNCTAESFNSTIFRHKKNRRYFHTADLIFIKTNSFLYNCIAHLARIGLFQLYYKAPCF